MARPHPGAIGRHPMTGESEGHATTGAHPPPAVISIARDAIANGATPGLQLSVRVGHADGSWSGWDHCDGALSYARGSARVTIATPYDLASVTKAIVALAIVRI